MQNYKLIKHKNYFEAACLMNHYGVLAFFATELITLFPK